MTQPTDCDTSGLEASGTSPIFDPAAQTREWVERVVVGLNFCPFAKRELIQQRINFRIMEEDLERALWSLVNECQRLDADGNIETSLLIFPAGLNDFHSFLLVVEMATDLLLEQGYEGVYQLATFHPDYCFEGSEADDPANYTNRSPYPTLHLIREASLERALEHYPDPESIPENNINKARELGLEKMQQLLGNCLTSR
ncbi:DUF1415 domain-containing protein [Aestuariirhabdus sp. Z084]|uniref:DUF1415 domain-containing protein n=1 Tax=Aestuariirhabdus haliotis TaxID=2918751 RepID=UPI00201B3586|nr:DUF1415 domain-containing protein [Aestuariirhabdus haliotis]MCL6415503.1 DUF1415 domain-containing protein [Aestuariirhabdus haliotis]MCL6419292.1 DUF1415 domain-containing protein [Aestuariirhabdus haliotis]